jgi:hypothetical protein
MTTWTPIKKGDRRPEGFVLVTYTRCRRAEGKLLRAIFGEGAIVDEPVVWRVAIARWRKDCQRWVDDGPKGYEIPNVIAWAPLPEPYEGEQ